MALWGVGKIEIEDAMFEVKLERARIKVRDCIYRRDTLCEYWQFIDVDKQSDSINEKFKKLPVKGKQGRSMYNVSEILCLECNMFRLKEEYTNTPKEKEMTSNYLKGKRIWVAKSE